MSFDKDPQQLFLECAAKPTPNSFKALYDATQMRLFPVCLRILKDHELAQDCLQASYVKVWHNLNNYDAQKSKAVTWMSRIIRNQALDMLKRKNFVDFVDDVPDMIDPISADINCNLWITNSDGALFVATLPETGEVTVDLSAYPEVLKKLNRPGLLQVTFDQKGTQPERMGAVMLEASWSI